MADSQTRMSQTLRQGPPGPFQDPIRLSALQEVRWSTGTGDDQFEPLLGYDVDDLAASGTVDFNFETDLDRFGVAVAGTSVAILYIEHKVDSLASSITVSVPAGTPWISLLNAAGTLTLRPGDQIRLVSRTAGNQAVNAGSRTLRITNDDGVELAGVVLQTALRR